MLHRGYLSHRPDIAHSDKWNKLPNRSHISMQDNIIVESLTCDDFGTFITTASREDCPAASAGRVKLPT